MGSNYTIYQQALDLQASGFGRFSSVTVGVGVAKFLQILLPQIAYLLTASVLTPERLLPIARLFLAGRTRESQLLLAQHWIQAIQRLQGFFVWKLACDLGFFLIVTQYGSWLRAFTLSGLVTYTAFQFVVYYLIGQKLILANLAQFQPKMRPKPYRTTRWKNLASKILYEEMGVTISQVKSRTIIAKFLVDYGAMWVTWSAYSTGFFLFANGGLGISPFFIFPHVLMSSLYISVYLGYAAMFTFAELGLKSIAFRRTIQPRVRKLLLSTQFKQLIATLAVTLILPLLVGTMTMSWKAIGFASSRITGVQDQWRISLEGNYPEWQPNKAMQTRCDPSCLKNIFSQGPYTTKNQ